MSYEQLLAVRDIDAVYIPLPNSLHAHWSIAAARAGKHVLCEKPLALAETEALEMFAAADAAGVVLLEAFPFLFQPQMLQIEQLVSSAAIGDIRAVSAFCGFSLGNPEDIRLDAKLGGGALLDAGCYAVSFIRQIVGCRPSRISGHLQFRLGAASQRYRRGKQWSHRDRIPESHDPVRSSELSLAPRRRLAHTD